MSPFFTEDQETAIGAVGGPVLVAAAAGSGKTAVLVERVLRRMTAKDPDAFISADRFLMVTFSNAAAAEMRQRIEAGLFQKAKEAPGDLRLQRQKMLLQRASISTVHAFCMRLVREHFSFLELRPDFRIGDEPELELLRHQAVETVLDTFYEEGDPSFYALVELVSSGRDDKKLVDVLYTLSDFMDHQPFPNQWLLEKGKMYHTKLPPEETLWGTVLLTHTQKALAYCEEALDHCLSLLREDEKMEAAYGGAFMEAGQLVAGLRTQVEKGDWDAILEAVQCFAFPKRKALRGYGDDPRKAVAESVQKTVKDTLAALKKQWVCTRCEFLKEIAYLSPRIEVLIRLTLAFREEFARLKGEGGMVDFTDLEHLALRLLMDESGKETPLCAEVAGKFDMVLVDEYQDTNEVQDMLFRLLSHGEKTLFLVGDVKQSIYRFRGAMPEIFARRLREARPYDGKHYPASITLSRNFRSREGICAGVNATFSSLFSKEVGGMDYGEGEALISGAVYPSQNTASTHVVLMEEGEKDGISTSLKEARAIAQKITQMVQEQFPVLDSPSGEMRPCRYGDFCVLLRSRTHTESYEKALLEMGLPAWSDFQKRYFSAKEVLYLLSLLRAIDNPLWEVELSSAMLSPIFGFSVDDLSSLRLSYPDFPLYLAAVESAKNGGEKAVRFLEILHQLRRFSVREPVDRVIEEALRLTRFDWKVRAMKNGEARLENIRYMVALASSYEAVSAGGLSGFNRYMGRLLEEGLTLSHAQALPEGENVVKIMTMHRSKGLEFPIVFVGDCQKRFNRGDLTSQLLLHERLGIGMKLREEERLIQYPTLALEALKIEIKKELQSEEMRVFYVALTRAKEHLFLVSSPGNVEKFLRETAAYLPREGAIPPFLVESASCYAQWLATAFLSRPEAAPWRQRAGLSGTAGTWDSGIETAIWDDQGVAILAQAEKTNTVSEDPLLLKELHRRHAYCYPYKESTVQESKVGASEKAERQSGLPENPDEILNHPRFLYDGRLSPTERGNAYHAFLEFVDFKKAQSSVQAEIRRLIAAHRLTEDEGRVLHEGQLSRFFKSALGNRLIQARQIWRELRFIYAAKGERAEEATMVQGIADCVFLKEGKLVIVDYKTDAVSSGEELIKRYRSQLAIYRRAVEESLGYPVGECVLYSFSLGQEIPLSLEDLDKLEGF